MAVTQTGDSSAPGPAGCCLHLQFGKLGCSRQLLVSSGVGEQSIPAARLDQVRALWECWEGSTHHHHFNGNMLTASPQSELLSKGWCKREAPQPTQSFQGVWCWMDAASGLF